MISRGHGSSAGTITGISSRAVMRALLFMLASLLVGCRVADEGQWRVERRGPQVHINRLQLCDAEVGELARKHCQRRAGMQ